MNATTFEERFPFAGSIEEQIKQLLTAAVRAPSTHNSQPWLFDLKHNRLRILRDTAIVLPQSDPQYRYTHVSIGFLIHHIEQLAKWLSMDPQITLGDGSEYLAEISFSPATKSASTSSLAEAIFTRRNRRGLFGKEVIPQDVLAEALAIPGRIAEQCVVRAVTDEVARNTIAEATAKNMMRVYARPAFRREMSKWITPTGSPRKTGLPGYTLNQPLIMSWILPTVIRFVNMGKVLAKLNRGSIASAPAAFGFSAEEGISGWLSVGYAASHAALTLTAHAFDYSVFVASIEYPDTRAEVGAVFGFAEPLQFVFVAGKLPGEVSWRTPRVAVDAKLT